MLQRNVLPSPCNLSGWRQHLTTMSGTTLKTMCYIPWHQNPQIHHCENLNKRNEIDLWKKFCKSLTVKNQTTNSTGFPFLYSAALQPLTDRQTYHFWCVVASKVLVTDWHEAPECLFCGHVHKQECCQWGLSLAKANCRVENRIRFKHLEQVLLPVETKVTTINTISGAETKRKHKNYVGHIPHIILEANTDLENTTTKTNKQ